MNAPAWLSDENLRERARQHFAVRPPLADIMLTADGPDQFRFLHRLLSSPAEPGPPYVHTLVSPAPCPTDCDPDCELNPDGCHERHEVAQGRDHDPDECEASRRPGPAYTLTEGL